MPDHDGEVQRYVHGIFCEDVHDRATGTWNYMGVFQSPAIVPSSPYPFTFAKLSVVFWVVCPITENLPEVEIFIETPDSEIAVPATATIRSPDDGVPGSIRRVAVGVIQASNVAVTKPGPLRLKIKAWGKVWIAAAVRLVERSE